MNRRDYKSLRGEFDDKEESSGAWMSWRENMAEHREENRGAKRFSRNYLRWLGVLITC
jgi:hypothetical protein